MRILVELAVWVLLTVALAGAVPSMCVWLTVRAIPGDRIKSVGFRAGTVELWDDE